MRRNVYINTSSAICPNGLVGTNDILNAVEPNYKDIITNANIRRRMSRFIKMGVACGLLCLEKHNKSTIDAIITSTGYGCLADTEKFLNSFIENNEQLINPTSFTQSTFNVVGAQIGLLTKNHCYNNTFVHRGLSFESALIDSILCIYEGYKNILVGAIDEATPTTQYILQRIGLLKNTIMGEGAQFFIVSDEKKSPNSIQLKFVHTYSGTLKVNERIKYIQQILKDNKIDVSAISHIIMGKNGNNTENRVYDTISEELFPDAKMLIYKNICGEHPTASSYGFYMAINNPDIQNSNESNVLLYNCYNKTNHSLILLKK